MTTTTFSSGTIVTSTWLNDVNTTVYKGAGQEIWSSAYGHLPSASAATNDAALLAAITAAIATGATVYIPAGTYQHVTVPVTLTSKPINIKGAGKGVTILQKSGVTTTTVLALTAGSFITGCKLADFSITGNTTCKGLETQLFIMFEFSNINISSCATGWHNYGCLIGAVNGLDLVSNTTGYYSDRVLAGSYIYPNLITFKGGQSNGNTIAFDLVYGDRIKFDSVDIENGASGVIIRQTIATELSYSLIEFTGTWFESNSVVSLKAEGQNGNTNGRAVISISNCKFSGAEVTLGTLGQIESCHVQDTMSISANFTVNASRSSHSNTNYGTLSDTSSSYVLTEIGTTGAYIQQRVGALGVNSDMTCDALTLGGGTTITRNYVCADSGTVDLPVGISGAWYGCMLFVRGRYLATGASYTRQYNIAIKSGGGGGSDIVSTLVASSGDATPAFTFSNVGGYLRVTATNSGGKISVIY